jgi:hypothetical protein
VSHSVVVADMSLRAGAGLIFSADNDHLLVFDNIARTEEETIVDWPLKVAAISLSTGKIVDQYRLPLHRVLPSLEMRFELSAAADAFAILCMHDSPGCFGDDTYGQVFRDEPSLASQPVEHHVAEAGHTFFEGGLPQNRAYEQPLGMSGSVFMDWQKRNCILRVTRDGSEAEIDLAPAFEGFCAAFPQPTPLGWYHHAIRLLPDPEQGRLAVGVSCSRPDEEELGARLVIVDLETRAVIAGVDDVSMSLFPVMGWSADGKRLAALVRSFGSMSTHFIVLQPDPAP